MNIIMKNLSFKQWTLYSFYLLALIAYLRQKLSANMDYWVPKATFESAACGVLKATQDYGYDLNAVKKQLSEVDISYQNCVL